MNVSTGPNASGPLMTEAGQIYLKAKGASRPLTFTQAVTRSVREDANSLRDALITQRAKFSVYQENS